jgi:hypothetical protein
MFERHSPDAFVAHFRVQRCGRALLTDGIADRAARAGGGAPRVQARYRPR